MEKKILEGDASHSHDNDGFMIFKETVEHTMGGGGVGTPSPCPRRRQLLFAENSRIHYDDSVFDDGTHSVG